MPQTLFKRVVKYFKEVLPDKFSVRRCKMPKGFEGDCDYKQGIYYIRISNKLSESEAINCFLHEAAHIGSMLKLDENNYHGRDFGLAYSKIYKLYEAEFT